MSKNPEEGRFTEETKAEKLRESRLMTAQMKRQLRAAKHKKEAEDQAKRWLARHRPAHSAADDDMVAISTASPLRGGGPLNRRSRRKFAKRMNMFKLPQGWQNFNRNYAERFGHMESHSRGNRARKDAAKLAKKNNGIADAIAKGDN